MEIDDLKTLFTRAQSFGYILLPDDYTAMGYMAFGLTDYRHVDFILNQINAAIVFINKSSNYHETLFHMEKEGSRYQLLRSE